MFINAEDYDKIVEQIPLVCVDLIIIFEDKFLLVKRIKSPAKNKFWFPGGRIYKMETIDNACKRIAKQETNLECHFIRQICTEETLFEKENDMISDKHTLNICCELGVKCPDKLKLDENHSDYIWTDRILSELHISVARPLTYLGFNYEDIS